MKNKRKLGADKTKVCWNKLIVGAGCNSSLTHEVDDHDVKNDMGEDEVSEASFW